MSIPTHHHTQGDPLTVGELRDRLRDVDPSYVVRAYEGPGCWIIVEDRVYKPGGPEAEVVMQFTTHYG